MSVSFNTVGNLPSPVDPPPPAKQSSPPAESATAGTRQALNPTLLRAIARAPQLARGAAANRERPGRASGAKHDYLVDPKTGRPSTIVPHTTTDRDTVSALVHNNPEPMTLDELYELNPQLDHFWQQDEPDALEPGQTIYLKGPANDEMGADTQRRIESAHQAEQSVKELATTLRSGGNENATSQALRERQAFAAQQWAEAKKAIAQELSAAANNPDPQALEKRRGQVENYSTGDPQYRKLVAETVADTQNLVQTVAIGREIEAAKPLGLPGQIKVLDQRLNGVSRELLAAAQQDSRVEDVVTSAAKYIQDGYELRGVTPPKDPTERRLLTGATEASKRLRELTETSPAWLSGKILTASQPTLDKIVTDIDKSSRLPPGPLPRGVSVGQQIAYLRATRDLSAAVTHASQDPANQGAIAGVAHSLALAIPTNDLGKMDFAWLASVQDANPDLAMALVAELKSEGRIERAGEVSRTIVSGLSGMRQSVTNALKDYDQAHLERMFMQGSAGWLADPQNEQQQADLQKFWADYANQHPELAKTERNLDRLGDMLVRTMETVSAQSEVFQGLKSEGELRKGVESVMQDETVLRAMNRSESAIVRIAQGFETGAGHSAISQLSADNFPREGRTLVFRAAMVFTGKQMATAANAVALARKIQADPSLAASSSAATEYAKAKTAIEKMRQLATPLGYSGDRVSNFNHMIDSFQEMIEANKTNDIARLTRATDTFTAAAKDPRNGPGFYPSTVSGAAMRLGGLALAYPIVKRQWAAIFNGDADAGTAAQAVFNSGLFAQQSLFLAGGMGRVGAQGALAALQKISSSPNPQLTAKLLGADDWVARGLTTLSHTAEPMALAGAITEGIVSLSYLGGNDPNYAMAGLHGVNAIGNASVALGYAKGTGRWATLLGRLPPMASPWMVGLGAGTVAVSSWLIYEVGKKQEASKFETQTTTQYLKTLGITEPVANALRDQNDMGASPAPVLAQLAADRGLDLSSPEHIRTFVRYLNDLGAPRMEAVVDQAHGVNASSDGKYPETDSTSLRYLRLPADPKAFSASPEFQASGSKIHQDAQTGTWVDPDTRMIYDEKNRSWVYYGFVGTALDKPIRWEPETGWLHLSGGENGLVKAESMEGLRAWMAANSYPLPQK
jgi:hypothetical protein